MVVVSVVLRDDALSVLAGVLVDKSIEGYPLADRAGSRDAPSRFLNGFGIFGPVRSRQNCRHLQPILFDRVTRRQPFLEGPGARRSGRKLGSLTFFRHFSIRILGVCEPV